MASKKGSNLGVALLDASVPLEHRKRFLLHLCMEGGPEADAVLRSLFEAAAGPKGEDLHAQKAGELAELLRAMQEGPLRCATFLQLLDGQGATPRAHVVLQDGTAAFSLVHDAALAASLRAGDTVLLEALGRMVVARHPAGLQTGEEARLERRLDDRRVEVTLHDQERVVLHASADLIDRLNAGAVSPGSTLLVCQRRGIAFEALPPREGLSHYQFLVKAPPPDVVVARDIGSPPPFIEELADHVRTEMTDPGLGRRYGLRRSVMRLLTGVSGSGKTLSIHGFWRRLYEVASEVTGVPLDRLPPRVFRLRAPDVLSKWLGESDQKLDRFFDEVEQLAAEPLRTSDGRSLELPVLAICEECDGLGRRRGEEATYDRILTTLLQRLDRAALHLKDRLVIFLFTTNVPHLVDPAFLRRAGGTVERFGRLDRASFRAVLEKHLHRLPCWADGVPDLAGARRHVADDLGGWLFPPDHRDQGMVELTLAGSSEPAVKYRRDFLTGALVDRAVQQAALEARREHARGGGRPGLSAAVLRSAFDRQIRSLVDQLHIENVCQYLDLPDGVRVSKIRRLGTAAEGRVGTL